MAELVPVDHDPFAEPAPAPGEGGPLVINVGGPQRSFVPVDHDPFAEPPSVAEDVAGGIQGGIIRGAAGLPGLPGTVLGLLETGADKLARHTVGRAINIATGRGNVADDQPAPAPHWTEAASPLNVLPTSESMVRHVEDVIGPTYRPQTTPGKYAATVGEFIGSGANPRSAIAGGLASEAAGQLAEGTGLEPAARIAASVVAPAAVGRVITPVRTNPTRAPFVQALEAEGVPLTAGDRTGSRALRGAENTLGNAIGSGGAAEHAAEETARGFNSAVARRMGENADNLGPETMQRAADRIGQQFNDLSARNTLQYDPQMGQDIAAVSQTYWRSLPPAQRQIFADWREAILDHLRQNQATIPGDLYQTTRSQLSRTANNIAQSDPELSRALGGLRNALDNAMSRSVRPEDAAAWNTAREQYGNMKTVERAMGGAGAGPATGNVSPQQIRTAAASGNRQAYVRGQSDLGELARAGEAVLRPIPNSGTAERSHAISLASGIATGIPTAIMTGDPRTALVGLGAALGPGVAGRALMSRPVQAYLGNQVLQPTTLMDRLARMAREAQAGYRSGSD
jgi:hypothetical protein